MKNKDELVYILTSSLNTPNLDLSSFDLTNQDNYDALVAHLSQHEDVTSLDISRCTINSAVLQLFANTLPNLTSLNLSYSCGLNEKSYDECLDPISKMHLRHLDIGATRFSINSLIEFFQNNYTIDTLDVSSEFVSEDGDDDECDTSYHYNTALSYSPYALYAMLERNYYVTELPGLQMGYTQIPGRNLSYQHNVRQILQKLSCSLRPSLTEQVDHLTEQVKRSMEVLAQVGAKEYKYADAIEKAICSTLEGHDLRERLAGSKDYYYCGLLNSRLITAITKAIQTKYPSADNKVESFLKGVTTILTTGSESEVFQKPHNNPFELYQRREKNTLPDEQYLFLKSPEFKEMLKFLIVQVNNDKIDWPQYLKTLTEDESNNLILYLKNVMDHSKTHIPLDAPEADKLLDNVINEIYHRYDSAECNKDQFEIFKDCSLANLDFADLLTLFRADLLTLFQQEHQGSFGVLTSTQAVQFYTKMREGRNADHASMERYNKIINAVHEVTERKCTLHSFVEELMRVQKSIKPSTGSIDLYKALYSFVEELKLPENVLNTQKDVVQKSDQASMNLHDDEVQISGGVEDHAEGM